MKHKQQEKKEEPTSLIKRLLEKKMTYDEYNKRNMKTAQERRMQKFYDKESK